MDTKALRQKILDLAIRGKLVPQDPNDEPASALLEHVRAEKQQMVKDGKLKPKDIKNDTIIFKGEDNLHYEQFQDGTVKCIEDEVPFEIPDGWAWCRLGTIYDHNTGKALNSSNINGVKLTYITTSNLYWDRFELDNLKEMPFVDAEIEKCTVRKGDLLVCEGGDIGRAAIWMFDENVRIQNHIHRLRAFITLSNRFYYYVFYLWKQLELIGGHGIGLQSLSSKAIHNIIMPLPPVNEQQRIAENIDRIFKFVDELDNKKDDLRSLIEDVKSRILDLAIRGKLVTQDPTDEPASVLLERIKAEKEELIKQGKIKRDKKKSVIFKGEDNSYYEKIGDEITCIDDEIPFEIPENWAFSRLKSIWELISGRDLSPSDYNDLEDGIPYITGASNFINGKISLVRWTPKPQVITNHGDLLITCKGTIGEIAINDFGKAHIARQIMAIRNIHNFNIDYLSLCLQFYIESIKQSAKGLIPGISREDVLNIILPVPPNKYQIEVVEAIQKYKEILNSIEANFN